MKKVIYALILPLVVAGGLVFAHSQINKKTAKKPTPTILSAAEREAEKKQWEATPAGIYYKKWTTSPTGKKVLADAAKINASTDMEAVITSLTLPPGSRLGYGVTARIDGSDYILTFDAGKPDELQQLLKLKVNDKIIIRSHHVSHAPKYSYAIISVDYAEQNNKQIYKRIPPKGDC